MASGAAIGIAAALGIGLLVFAGTSKAKPKAKVNPYVKVKVKTPGPGPTPNAKYPTDVNTAIGIAAKAQQEDCPDVSTQQGEADFVVWQQAWTVLHSYNATTGADDNTRTAEVNLAAVIEQCQPDVNYPDDVAEALDWALAGSEYRPDMAPNDQTNLSEVRHYLAIIRGYNANDEPTEESQKAEEWLAGMEKAILDYTGAGGTF